MKKWAIENAYIFFFALALRLICLHLAVWNKGRRASNFFHFGRIVIALKWRTERRSVAIDQIASPPFLPNWCSRVEFEQIGVRTLISPSTRTYMVQHKGDRGHFHRYKSEQEKKVLNWERRKNKGRARLLYALKGVRAIVAQGKVAVVLCRHYFALWLTSQERWWCHIYSFFALFFVLFCLCWYLRCMHFTLLPFCSLFHFFSPRYRSGSTSLEHLPFLLLCVCCVCVQGEANNCREITITPYSTSRLSFFMFVCFPQHSHSTQWTPRRMKKGFRPPLPFRKQKRTFFLSS